MVDLSKFQSTGAETCFHGRHIGAQIYADLNGRNWSLKDYEARGGYPSTCGVGTFPFGTLCVGYVCQRTVCSYY